MINKSFVRAHAKLQQKAIDVFEMARNVVILGAEEYPFLSNTIDSFPKLWLKVALLKIEEQHLRKHTTRILLPIFIKVKVYCFYMPEGQSIREVEPKTSLADAVREVFERRATKGERKLILELYEQKFEQLLATLPKANRDTMAIKIQKFGVKIGAYISEYGARFSDYIRNIFVWPMIAATRDFPKDKYYQIELARAKAWGEFGRDTTKTATQERMAYRNHFLHSALTGVGQGSIFGALGGALFAASEGAKIGFMGGGLYGAAIGAAVGGTIGGAVSLTLAIKDRLLGPPVIYYNLFGGGGGGSIRINTGGGGSLPTIPSMPQ